MHLRIWYKGDTLLMQVNEATVLRVTWLAFVST